MRPISPRAAAPAHAGPRRTVAPAREQSARLLSSAQSSNFDDFPRLHAGPTKRSGARCRQRRLRLSPSRTRQLRSAVLAPSEIHAGEVGAARPTALSCSSSSTRLRKVAGRDEAVELDQHGLLDCPAEPVDHDGRQPATGFAHQLDVPSRPGRPWRRCGRSAPCPRTRTATCRRRRSSPAGRCSGRCRESRHFRRRAASIACFKCSSRARNCGRGIERHVQPADRPQRQAIKRDVDGWVHASIVMSGRSFVGRVAPRRARLSGLILTSGSRPRSASRPHWRILSPATGRRRPGRLSVRAGRCGSFGGCRGLCPIAR